jgi:hypothetical protein
LLDRVAADDRAGRAAATHLEERDAADVPVVVRGVELEEARQPLRDDVVTIGALGLLAAKVVRVRVADLLDRADHGLLVVERPIRSQGPWPGTCVGDAVRESQRLALLLVHELQVRGHNGPHVGEQCRSRRSSAAIGEPEGEQREESGRKGGEE